MIPFRLRAGTVPAGQTCITDLQGVLNAVQKFVTVQVPEGFTLVIIDDATPTTEQQDALWIQLNENGTPEGSYVFGDGEWRRVPPLAINHITFWTGNVAEIPNGWHLCDGNDSAPDLTANNNLWEGGSPDSVNYAPGNLSYSMCPIVWQGTQN